MYCLLFGGKYEKLHGKDVYETIFDILVKGHCVGNACYFTMCEEDIEHVMKYDRAMICTDSGVAGNNKVYHPRLRATFPRVLGRYVRERGVVSLPEMIRKMTSLPAYVYGLDSKGKIAEGGGIGFGGRRGRRRGRRQTGEIFVILGVGHNLDAGALDVAGSAVEGNQIPDRTADLGGAGEFEHGAFLQTEGPYLLCIKAKSRCTFFKVHQLPVLFIFFDP